MSLEYGTFPRPWKEGFSDEEGGREGADAGCVLYDLKNRLTFPSPDDYC